MAYEFRLPDLGEGLTEGEVARWLVAEGDEIAEDQPLVEIQTDKTTVEIPSPAAGTVTKILVADGDVVPVGTVLVVIGGERRSRAVAAPVRDASDHGWPRPPQHRRPRAGPGDAARPPDRRRAGRRPRDPDGDRAGRADHGGRRARRRGCLGGARARGPPREAPGCAAPDRRAPDAGPPRDSGRHVRRGVRLLARST